MNIPEATKWLRFYANVIGINIWNGSIMYMKVAVAAGGAEAARGFDIRTVDPKMIFWTWVSAVAVHIILELSKNMLPNPKPPETP